MNNVNREIRVYGRKAEPPPITSSTDIVKLVDEFFLAYNAARLREACCVFAEKMLDDEVTVGLTISGALTPAGLSHAAFVPLIDAGFVDWIVSTGANLYHDLHRTLGYELYQIGPHADDEKLHDENIIRIFDLVLDKSALLKTDDYVLELLKADEFQKRMSTAELHYRLGRYARQREKDLDITYRSLLGAAYEAGVPIYTSSPGDSTLGMQLATLRLRGYQGSVDTEADVNETSAIVYDAQHEGGRSAIVVLGGGSPKNFALQTEPQIQDVLKLPDQGHDYYIQFTDARVDTGGLSGATPSEAMTWGKIAAEQLPDSVVCYTDSTIALPILTAYALAKHPPRKQKRLYDRREQMTRELTDAYLARLKRDGPGAN